MERGVAGSWLLAVAALLSAAATTAAFPPWDQGWLAWLALVPLVVVCRRLAPGTAFGVGLLAGFLAANGIFLWMFQISGYRWHHALLLGTYLGLYPAIWCAALPVLARSRAPWVVTAPALWVILDAIRAHAGFLALPWATLGQSQHRDLAILQSAALGGELAITGLVVLANVALGALLTERAWRATTAAAAVIVLAHAGGGLVLAVPPTSRPVVLAAVQPSIGIVERVEATGRATIIRRLERLTVAAAQARPALIAWPETAVADLRNDPFLAQRVQALARSTRIPLLVGSSEVVKFAPAESAPAAPPAREVYNTAYLVLPDSPLGEPYRKMRLVPFAEYLPLVPFVTWPRWLVSPGFAVTPGYQPRVFTLPSGVRAGTLICWESLFADLARGAVEGGADLLVLLTNDAWFGRTGAAAQHNLSAVMRAVENRTPVVIASNTGPSAIVDSDGRVVGGALAPFSEGVVIAAVSVRRARAAYTWISGALVPVALVAVALGLFWRSGKEEVRVGQRGERDSGSEARHR